MEANTKDIPNTQFLMQKIRLITGLTSRIFNATNITLTRKRQNNVDEFIKLIKQLCQVISDSLKEFLSTNA
ncbi:UPF0178 protein [Dirofilaria immitis]